MNPANPPGADEFYALLAVIADPVAHKQRLDELVAQENSTKEQIAALNEMAADTRRLHSTAEAENIVSNNRKLALDAREAEIADKAKSLDLAATEQKRSAQQTDQKFKQREDELSRREAAVAADEARAKALLDKASADADAAATLRADLERRAAAVQEALK